MFPGDQKKGEVMQGKDAAFFIAMAMRTDHIADHPSLSWTTSVFFPGSEHRGGCFHRKRALFQNYCTGVSIWGSLTARNMQKLVLCNQPPGKCVANDAVSNISIALSFSDIFKSWSIHWVSTARQVTFLRHTVAVGAKTLSIQQEEEILSTCLPSMWPSQILSLVRKASLFSVQFESFVQGNKYKNQDISKVDNRIIPFLLLFVCSYNKPGVSVSHHSLHIHICAQVHIHTATHT